MQKERSRMREQEEQDKPQSEFIQRKSLCQLIYKKLEDVSTVGQYKQAVETYPLLSDIYSLVKEFHCNILQKTWEVGRMDRVCQEARYIWTAVARGGDIERFDSYQKWNYLSI